VRLGATARTGSDGDVHLWLVRGFTASDVCVSLQVPTRGVFGSHCDGTIVAPSLGIRIGPVSETASDRDPSSPSAAVIGGLAPKETTQIKLGFANGRTVDVPAHAGAWVAEIPSRSRVHGRQLDRITALDQHDGVVATEKIPTPRPSHRTAP
jgi:hypothetical protein